MCNPFGELMKKTKDELISIFQGLLEDRNNVSRNQFRELTEIPDSEWEREFGTFTEFKRAAGALPTRQQTKFNNAIAKHASLDAMRKYNEERRSFAGKYLKPSDKRYQTILVGSDIHDIECCPFWRRTFLDTAKRTKPEQIVLNGDLFDLPEFSRYTVDPRTWDVVGRIKWVHKFLEDLRKASPNSELYLVEGNHECRLLKQLTEEVPALNSILSDLHDMTIPKLLGLDKYEVNYIANADMVATTSSEIKKEVSRNYLILHEFLLFHHFPEGSQMGLPGVNGHHHKHICQTHHSPIYGTYEWHQIGSGHRRAATYCNGEKWSNGFMLIHADVEDKRAQFEYIDTTHDHVVIGGKWYTREPDEI